MGHATLPPARVALHAVLVVGLLAPRMAFPDDVRVEPARVLAGSWYDGATLKVSGGIAEGAQVAIRVTGALEHRAFNRRDRIGGVVWGGVEHVTFEDAPGLYALYTSAALGAIAPPALRERLRLGYDTLAAHMDVRHGDGRRGAAPMRALLIDQLVQLKESEGLYRVAPGAVHLSDAVEGRRAFEVAVPLPATAPPGEIEVTVLELAGGAVVHEATARVPLVRVGMPAFLFRLAHEQGTAFGLLAVFALVVTGVGVDLLGSRRYRRPHPAVVLLSGLARGVDDSVLAARQRPRSQEQVERMLVKYRLFRTLLAINNEVLEHLADLEEESSWSAFHHSRVRMGIRALFDGTADMVGVLNELTAQRYFDLANVVSTLRADVFKYLEKASERGHASLAVRMSEIGTENADQVGDKAVSLARVECDVGLAVPPFFSVTVDAYRDFLEAGGLASQLRTILAPARLDAPDDFRRRCEFAQQLVREARVPQAVAEAIATARTAAGFAEDERFAVRSSASGEGSELSFAGQFESFLNVPATGLVEAWRSVVASRFSPRAVFYRRAAGLAEVDTPMSVLVQRMVRARASGVMFTRRPDAPRGAELLVTAVPGLGPEVSAGVASADQFLVARAPPHRVLERRIAPKRARLVEAEGGGLRGIPLEGSLQLQPSLVDPELVRLAEAAAALERYFGTPQDVEWVVDLEGNLQILQARPLRTERPEPALGQLPVGTRPLLSGGDAVWQGRAVGPVYVARTAEEEEDTPAGALLVVPQLLPDCVRLLPRVCGIVAEHGTVTGHAASILREFRIPSLFGVKGALDALAPGRLASLDVASRSVYEGALWPELRGRLPLAVGRKRAMGLPELLAGKLTKLNRGAFMGTWACQSLHDVVRFAHEMAIQSMFDLGDRLLDSPVGGVKTVDTTEPIYVHLVDLGGGLRPEAAATRSVTPADVVSVPFQGLWRGLADASFHPRRSERPPPSPSVLAATRAMAGAGELGVPNYACITDSYLNLHARGELERDPLRARPRRQAYHYVVVDSFLSENANENHIRMRFRGGGAAPWQRRLRAEVAAEVLRLHHFTVSVTGELMNAWIRGPDRATGAAELATVGRLLRFLARLDMWMTEEADVGRRVAAFLDAEAEALAPTRDPGKASA